VMAASRVPEKPQDIPHSCLVPAIVYKNVVR
jgi:hypothetical protein